MSNYLRVEINDSPRLSFLWFYPYSKAYGIALINTTDKKMIEHLKRLKEILESENE